MKPNHAALPTEDDRPGGSLIMEGRSRVRPARPAVEPDDPRVLEALEEYLAAVEAGRPVDPARFLKQHSAIEDALKEALEGLNFINEMGGHMGDRAGDAAPSSAPDVARGQPLGDFRILRQIGHGGMGVVYEAEQLSLGRRVALKVLPFAAALDGKQLQRFKNEAQAAAQLHHQHIVPVYGVGCERGVHYYAMQFIDGHTLAQVIADLRSQISDLPSTAKPSAELAGAEICNPQSEICNPTTVAALSTERSATSPAFFRTVAGLGVQAAEALEHAHQMGVIHRDVKPGNLLIDARGKLWITDFGLAQFQGDNRLTLTGDILGTLRYMSPEAALAKRIVVDHRTDIYSLGVTLYELLTLEPVFNGEDRQELLRQIAFEEPAPPRRLSKAIPEELETIVLKALEKNPAERYGTAQELADDLQRFLRDEPIRARRPTLVQRGRKWARRHRPVVVATIVATAMVLAVTVVTLLISLANISAALTDKSNALEEKSTALRQESAALDREKETTYLQQTVLAGRELAAGNVGRAEELLDGCPKHLRGWEWHFLKRQRYGNPVAPMMHEATVTRVVFSPNGRHIATVCMDGTVGIREARTGRLLHDLEPKKEKTVLLGASLVRGITYSRDGRYLAVARNDGLIKVWEAGGQLVHSLKPAGEGPTWQVAFSPDGRTLASAGADRSVRLWDLASERIIQEFSGHPAPVMGVTFRPDGDSVVAACDDGTVKVWDRNTGKATFEFRDELLAYPAGCFFSLDARRLGWACLDGFIHVWDTTTGRLEINQQTNTHQCRTVAFHPDGKRIAVAGFDGNLQLLDANGREMFTIFAHTSPIAYAAFSADGHQLASASYDHAVRLWDATPLADDFEPPHCVTLRGHKDKVSGVAFSADGRWLASGSWDHSVKVWECSPHAEREGYLLRHTLTGHRGIVMGVAFSSDNRTLASAGWDKTVRLWDMGAPVLKTGQPGAGDSLTEKPPIAVGQRVNSIAFSPDGQRLAVAQENRFAFYDPASGKQVQGFKRTPAAVPSMVFHPTRPLLISTGASDPTVRVWDLARDQFSFEIRHNSNPNACAVVSPDGRFVAAGVRDAATGDHTVKLWNVDWEAKTHPEFRTLRGHRGYVWRVAFSPDGRYLASGSWDSTVKIWDLEAPESAEPVTLRGHAGFIQSLAFSPDGKRLATGSGYAGNGEVKVWDAVLWERRAVIGE